MCSIAAILCGCAAWGSEDSPALPPGLSSEPTNSEKPSEPALPPGLGGGTGQGTPSLPPGLGTEEPSSPALPPGLGQEQAATESLQPEQKKSSLKDKLPPINGFAEGRAGVRTQADHAQPSDATIGEMRLQLRTKKDWSRITVESDADFYADGIEERGKFDLRRLRLGWRPVDWMDVSAGRQVLTWGTGDMLFINDLFPKDWVSFFIGRDVEYLKAPSDALKVGLFSDALNVEVAYTPQFDPDRYITGRRISYWNPLFGRHSGQHDQVDANAPSDWFEDDEWAVRAYRNVGSYELAFYGYSGYWKSPGGQKLWTMQATFPRLNVYGASLRGPVGKGVGNVELGYYDSPEDRGGSDPFTNNSELRLLVGYEQELAKEFTGAFQYYLEHMMDYGSYRDAPIVFWLMEPRDKDRHVFTVRLTKLLMNQTLTLSLFTYFSPSDTDAYLRPNISYKVNDNLRVEAGGNVFLGEHDYTFFGQFENNTNVYAGFRYSF